MIGWGKLLIMDARGCIPNMIRCQYRIRDFSEELVERIEMKAYGPTILQHFGDGNKCGWTLLQLIETSNIVAHFAEESNEAYIDVFSCKDFHQKDAEDVVRKYFWPSSISSRMLDRGLR